MKKYEELERLNKLKENGTLSEEEFEKEKRNILNETSGNSSKINQNIIERYSEKNKTETKIANKKAIKTFLISFIIVILSIGVISAVVAIASQKAKSTVSKSNTENTYNSNVQNKVNDYYNDTKNYEDKDNQNTVYEFIDYSYDTFDFTESEIINRIMNGYSYQSQGFEKTKATIANTNNYSKVTYDGGQVINVTVNPKNNKVNSLKMILNGYTTKEEMQTRAQNTLINLACWILNVTSEDEAKKAGNLVNELLNNTNSKLKLDYNFLDMGSNLLTVNIQIKVKE